MIGDIAVIDDAIEALKSMGLEGLKDHLSCKIKFPDDKKHAWLGQPHLFKNLENKFGWLVNNIQSHKTPGAPKFLIVRPTDKIKKNLIKGQ